MSAHDAERALVGATLRAPDTLRDTVSQVTEATFADPRLGAVYATAAAMWAARQPVDALTVHTAMIDRGQAHGIDALFLFDLIEATPVTTNAGHYARIVAEAAQRRALGALGAHMQQLAHADDLPVSDVMTEARAGWERLSRTGATTLDAEHLDTLLADVDTAPDWLIPGLLERGDRLMVTGGEGGGKTTFMRQIALTAAAGVHPFTWQPIDPIRVLVIDAENRRAQWRRQARGIADAATRYGSDPSQRFAVATVEAMPKGRLNLTDDRDLSAVHNLIDQHTPDLLVIGPLYKLMPKAINSDDDAAPLINALDALRGRGLALAIEAHAGHALGAGGERDLRPRGSSALLGWPEFGLGLRRRTGPNIDPRDEHRSVDVVRWRGDRETGRAWPLSLYADPRAPFPWLPEHIEPGAWHRPPAF